MLRFGPYEVHEELGRGGMGVVYRGFDPMIQRDVALKTIKLYDITDENERRHMQDRLAREAQSAGRLSHPNIVTIYQVGYAEALPGQMVAYIAMEFVPGRTLAAVIEKSRPSNYPLILKLLRQTAEGLDYAHAQGVIHRDIKPANLLITPDGRLKITDFGVAKLVSHTMTMTGTVLGSPFYMSPEQIKAERVDGRTDQYALAVVAYEVFGGRKPFQADTLSALVYKIAHEDAPQLHLESPALAGRLNPVLQRAMAKDAAARYPNCVAFIEALERAYAEPAAVTAARMADTQDLHPLPAPALPPPVSPQPVPPPAQPAPRAPKPVAAAQTTAQRPPWMGAAAGLGLAGILLAGGWTLFRKDTPTAATPIVSMEEEPAASAAERTSGVQTTPATAGAVTSRPVSTPVATAPVKEPPRPPAAPPPARAEKTADALPPSPLVTTTAPGTEPPAKSLEQVVLEPRTPAPPPAPEPAREPVREPVRTPPRLLQRAPAAYTNEARAAGIEGIVRLSVDIDERGIPVRARVLQSLDAGLDRNAIQSLGGWRFQPATEDGRPVPFTATVEVQFSLAGVPSKQAPSLKKLKP